METADATLDSLPLALLGRPQDTSSCTTFHVKPDHSIPQGGWTHPTWTGRIWEARWLTTTSSYSKVSEMRLSPHSCQSCCQSRYSVGRWLMVSDSLAFKGPSGDSDASLDFLPQPQRHPGWKGRADGKWENTEKTDLTAPACKEIEGNNPKSSQWGWLELPILTGTWPQEVSPMRDMGTHGALPSLTTFINHELTIEARVNPERHSPFICLLIHSSTSLSIISCCCCC